MIVISVYIPVAALQKVSQAMFKAGAGRIGKYEQCSFVMKGTGQFLPLEGSNPAIGRQNVLETVEEMRLEVTTEEQYFDKVMQALFDSHPYEEPAWNAFKSLETTAKNRAKF